MTKVIAIMSMSLDGYVADANDGVGEVFDWYFSGDVEVPTASASSGMTFRVSPPSAEHLRGLVAEIGAAFAQAEEAAGGKEIGLAGGADVAQQFLRAGLVDEMQLHVVPVLLGGGTRLLDNLEGANLELECIRVLAAPGVTHLKYRIGTPRV